MILQVHSKDQAALGSFNEPHIWRWCSWHIPVQGSGPRHWTSSSRNRNSPEQRRWGSSDGEQKHSRLSKGWQLPAAELGSELSCRPVELATRDGDANAAGAFLVPPDDLNPEWWGSTAQGQSMINGYRMSQAGQTHGDWIALILPHRTIYCHLMWNNYIPSFILLTAETSEKNIKNSLSMLLC